MENRPEFLATWTGLAKLGVTAALINTNLTGRALEPRDRDATARTLVIAGGECLDRLASAGERPRARSSAGLTRRAREPTPRCAARARAISTPRSRRARRRIPIRRLRDGLAAGDDLFYIYTSGTTGLPKAARFSHMRFLGVGDGIAAWRGLRPDDVIYCALPLYHSAGGVMRRCRAALCAGATLALRRRFSARASGTTSRRYGVTVLPVRRRALPLPAEPAAARRRPRRTRCA